MENKELLFNLLKKLDSGEILFTPIDKKGEMFLTDGENKVKVMEFGDWISSTKDNQASLELNTFTNNPEGNKEFKEKFYKEKGLDKCGYKDCSNKIFRSNPIRGVVNPVVDYKAVNIECKDKHKRYICLDCYNNKHEM